MAVFAYATIGANDLVRALAFYDDLLAVAGLAPVADHGSGGRVYGAADGPRLAVLPPHDGGTATAGNGTMFAFRFDRRIDVAAFHDRALALGGTSEGAPGLRAPDRYYAYVRDLDGNKLCAFSVQPD